MADVETETRTIICWDHKELASLWRRQSFMSEIGPEPGWHIVAVWERCPGDCQNGEVWNGSSDLASCSVCDGRGRVPLGVGGALLNWAAVQRSTVDGEEIVEYRTTFRKFMRRPSKVNR